MGAATAPTLTKPLSTAPIKLGMAVLNGFARLESSWAATLLSVGRATRSTKPMVNRIPSSSRTRAASCSVEAASFLDAALLVKANHSLARMTAASAALSRSEELGNGVYASVMKTPINKEWEYLLVGKAVGAGLPRLGGSKTTTIKDYKRESTVAERGQSKFVKVPPD